MTRNANDLWQPAASFIQRSKSLVCTALLLCALVNISPAQHVGLSFDSLHKAILSEADTSQVTKAITLSRDIHKNRHDADLEYKLANLAVNKALELNDTLLYARALDNLGLLYRFHEAHREAISYHYRAFHFARNKSGAKPVYLMRYANNAAVAARYSEQYDLAISYYLNALKLAEQEKNLKNIAISSNGIGTALSNINERNDETLAYFQRALSIERELNDSLGMAMNLLSISRYHIANEQYVEAFAGLEELKLINRLRNDAYGIALSEEAFGDAYTAQKRSAKKAEAAYLKALAGYENAGNQTDAAKILFKLGKAYLSGHEKKNALTYFTQSMEISEEIGNKSLVKQNSYAMAELYESDGNYKNALFYYRKGKAFEDNIGIDRQRVETAALLRQFELDRKESKIHLLQDEQTLKEKLISNQKYAIWTQGIYLFLLLLAGGIATVFGILQYHIKKKKRVTEIALREKEKQLLKSEYEKNLAQAEIIISRMQINPHFIFNSLNAINLLIQQKKFTQASDYLVRFSRFIRRVLELPKYETISLAEELELIESYLKLEEARFANDFSYRVEGHKCKNLSQVKIPPLLLQPFVENAIWHGLLPAHRDKKELNIIVNEHEKQIEVMIEDNGVGLSSTPHQVLNGYGKKSMGMKITQDRIDQFNASYNCKIDVEVKNRIDEKGTMVILKIHR